MADTIRRVEYFYIQVPTKPGEGARQLGVLKEAGINLLVFLGFPQGQRSQLDFVPADPPAFRQAAQKAGWKLTGPKRAFLIQGDDRVGVMAEVHEKLAALADMARSSGWRLATSIGLPRFSKPSRGRSRPALSRTRRDPTDEWWLDGHLFFWA